MKRALLTVAVGLAGALFDVAAQAGDGWSSLWQTADQRGERLMQQGKPADAAKTYGDPRRRAYAELTAGDYASAANDLSALDDGDAHYNRGNALAHAGDLQGALKAYDAALARDPNDRDARRNRDLVAKALDDQQKKQKDQKSDQKPGQKQDQKTDQKGNGQQQEASSGQGQPGQDGKPGGGPEHPQEQSANDKSKDQEPGKNPQDARAAGSGNSQPQPAPQSSSSKPGEPGQPGQPGTDQDSSSASGEATQARNDAKAALRPPVDSKATPETGDAARSPSDADTTATAAPPSENQLALDQWLRRIPDDPGGLLRRKFMIEHLMKQQDPQP